MLKGNVYHCYVFTVPPNTVYDVGANHYPTSRAMWENINIYVNGNCYVKFHATTNDKIPIYADEETLVVSNFRFHKIYIGNESSSKSVDVRILIFSKNELPA